MLDGRDRRGGRPRAGRRSSSRRATTGCARCTTRGGGRLGGGRRPPQAALPRSVERDPRRLPDPRARGRAASRSSTSTAPRRRRSRRAVIEAIDSYYRNSNANIHRSMHELAAEADRALRGRPRARSPRFVGAPSARDRVRAQRDRGDQPRALHLGPRARRRGRRGADHARWSTTRTSCPWQLLCAGAGRAARVPRASTREGRLDLDELDAQLAAGGVKLVARRARLERARARSTRSPRSPQRAHAAGATVLVDGAQAVPQLPVDVAATGADFYAFTGHKMLGPDRHRRAVGHGASCSRRCRRSSAAASMIKRRRGRPLDLGRRCRRSSRPARPRSPRRSGSARPSTT